MKPPGLRDDDKRRLILFVLWLAVHVLLYIHFGSRVDLSDVRIYLNSANLLLRTGHLSGPDQFFYVTHIGIIAIFNTIFPNEILPVIIFQCFVSLLAVFSLYAAGKKLFDDSDAGFVTAILFLVWWDCIGWNVTLMTESLFGSVSCCLLYSLTKFTGKRIQFAGIFLLLLASITIRPTGFIFWIAAFFFFFHQHQFHFENNRPLKVALIIVGIIVTAFLAFKMFSVWDFTEQYAKGNIITYADQFHDPGIRKSITIQISDKEELLLDHRHPLIKILNYATKNPFDFFKAAFFKAAYLLSGVRPYYSWSHNVYNAGWMVLIYVSFLRGISRVKGSPVTTFVLIVVAVNVFLVSIATVDWDNRFYIPMEAGILCFSGGGLWSFIKSYTGRSNVPHSRLLD